MSAAKNAKATRRRAPTTFRGLLELWGKTAVSRGPGALKLEKERIEDAWHVISVDMGLRLDIISELTTKSPSSNTKLQIRKECKELEKEIDFCSSVGLYLIHLNHR